MGYTASLRLAVSGREGRKDDCTSEESPRRGLNNNVSVCQTGVGKAKHCFVLIFLNF